MLAVVLLCSSVSYPSSTLMAPNETATSCASLQRWQVLDNPHTLLCTGADWPRQTHCILEKHQLLLQSRSTGLLADEQALT